MLVDEFENDFRRDAIEASIREVRGSGIQSLLDSRCSLCLPTDKGRSSLHSQIWLVIVSVGVSIVSFVCAGAIVASQQKDVMSSILGLALVVIGIESLLMPLLCQGLLIRKHLADRFSALQNNPDLADCFSVGIEDPTTFSKMKVVADDVAYVGVDPMNRRLIIEGVLCRYLVYAKDVERIDFEFQHPSPGTEIVYRIDDNTVLGIMIEKLNLRAETVRQLGGGAKNVVYERIREALG